MKRVMAFLSLMLVTPAAFGQIEIDNKGDDFILAWLPATIDGFTPAIEVHLTSDVPTMVTVEYPVNAPTFTTTVAVNPGGITVVSLPTSLSSGPANGWTNDAVSNNCVRAHSDNDFVAYTISRVTFTSDAALALPIDTMNNEYILADYSPSVGVPSEFVVFAAFDGTVVTITPSVQLVGGHVAGTPYDVVLNRGQGYLGRSNEVFGPGGSITGTIVESSKPVGVTNGSECVNIPIGFTACDHIYEVAQPVQTWGSQFLVANLPLRPGGSIYRIIGSQDGTSVQLDGAPLAMLNRGQFFETSALTGNHLIAADKPIYVTQFMTGQSFGGASTGDPAMGNVIPFEQYLTDYTFSTIGGGQFAQNFLTVVANNLDLATITLDGALIGAGSFAAIGGTGFSVALLPLAEGAHSTSSAHPHGVTVEGYNTFDSYLYPGGASFAIINNVGDANAPLCETMVVDADTIEGLGRDDRPTEDANGNDTLDSGEDLNGNGQIDVDTGIFIVDLAPGSMNVSLVVDPFVPGAPMVGFQVLRVDPSMAAMGTVRIQDGAGNLTTCPAIFGENCFTLDFSTEDDFSSPLVNGQHINTEFGVLVALSSSGANAGLGIFDSSSTGPNNPSQDLDLLVNTGNLLILQTENLPPDGSDVFPRPNDDSNGGTMAFAFAARIQPRSLRLVDIDATDPTSSVVLLDGAGRMRTYTVPTDWTGDSSQRTLDLTVLTPQPGFNSTATASETPGFDPSGVVRVEVRLGGSGALDDLSWCSSGSPALRAQATLRNGSGVNPVILRSLATPLLGGHWVAELDAGGHASGVTLLQMRALPLAGSPTPHGELLVSGALLANGIKAHSGGRVPFTQRIPAEPALLGFEICVQGAVLGAPGPVLSNALDLTLGY